MRVVETGKYRYTTTMLTKLLILAAAGALGTLARVGVSLFVSSTFGTRFPWGTLAVNLAGCFLFGLFWSLGEAGRWLSIEQRGWVLAGFMGAFTTFSTYGFEALALVERSPWVGTAFIVAQNGLGLASVWLGMRAGT